MISPRKLLFLSLILSLSISACEESSYGSAAETSTEGTFNLEITDAPIDDSDVQAVYITVADIQLDGRSIENFSKKTFNLSELQNGSTRLLANGNVQAKSYSQLTLVLDFEEDSKGKTPGAYAVTEGGQKDKLESSTNEVVFNKSFEITPGRQTNFVMDFDLRKSVQRTSSNPNDLNFASSGSLRNFIRLVKKDETGIIKGKMNNYNPDSDGKIIVYAYKKGTFDQAVETDLQAQVQFSNAITSTTTDAIGEYELHFLEAGDYEVIFASYKDEDQNGQLELSGKASVSPLAALDLSTISVAANSTATVNVDLSGVFPF